MALRRPQKCFGAFTVLLRDRHLFVTRGPHLSEVCERDSYKTLFWHTPNFISSVNPSTKRTEQWCLSQVRSSWALLLGHSP